MANNAPDSFYKGTPCLWRIKDVLKVIPVSPSTWYRGVQEGRYPKGVKLSPHVTVWSSVAVMAIVDRVREEEARGR